MKTWNELDGSLFFNKVLTRDIKIGVIKLFPVTIDNERPKIILEFDIDELPDAPPEKWIKEGFNTCRIGLNCGMISGVIIKNIPTADELMMSIEKTEAGYFVQAKSNSSCIEFLTRSPHLSGPSVYFDDPDSACY